MTANTLTIASACYQLDYDLVLNSNYGKKLFYYNEPKIADNRMLIINNVDNEHLVNELAENAKRNKIIDEFFFVSDKGDEALASLGCEGVSRASFIENASFVKKIKALLHCNNGVRKYYDGYISSIPAITAISQCTTDYLLYFDEDAYLYENESRSWINESIELMDKNEKYVVANPIWNGKKHEAESESTDIINSFYVSQGFSNQCFLVNVHRIKNQFNFNEKTPHYLKKKYPYYAGNCLERRFATYMYHHNLYRLTAMNANYFHKDFTPELIAKWKSNNLV